MKKFLETIESTFAIVGIFSLVIISFLAVNQLNPVLETPVSASVAGISDARTNIPIKYTNVFNASKYSTFAEVLDSESNNKGINYIVALKTNSTNFEQKVLSIYNPNNGYKEITARTDVSDFLMNNIKVTLVDDRDSIVLYDSAREENPAMTISLGEF